MMGKKLERKKKPHWSDLEIIGDAHLLWRARMELRRICGEENWHLVKLLEDHAKGNPFLAQVGKHYKLDEWVRACPRLKYPKDWADLVEAWIGAIIRERLLFDENDSLEELNEFFSRLWRLRYRSLNEYFLGVQEAGRNINLEKVEILEEKRVTSPAMIPSQVS